MLGVFVNKRTSKIEPQRVESIHCANSFPKCTEQNEVRFPYAMGFSCKRLLIAEFCNFLKIVSISRREMHSSELEMKWR